MIIRFVNEFVKRCYVRNDFQLIQELWDADTEWWYRYTYGKHGPVIDEDEEEELDKEES